LNTKKIVFIGIRNKYCVVCERAKNKGVIASEHTCFINWKGSSTGMEADAIAEGFSISIELHGIKFNKLIGMNFNIEFACLCIYIYIFIDY